MPELAITFILQDLIRPDIWLQWDQSHYIEIARHGYEAFSCKPMSGFNDGDWCGNASWFPLFPFIIFLLNYLSSNSQSLAVIGLACTNLFFVLILFFLIPLLSEDISCVSSPINNLFRASFFIFFPASIFFHANYPLSVAVFFLGISLHFAFNNQPIRTIPFSVLACLSYPPLIVLTVPIAFLGLTKVVSSAKSSLPVIKISLWTLASITPLLSYRLGQDIIARMSGVPNAFHLVGAKYGHGINNPLYAFKSVLIRASNLNDYSSMQTLFILLCLLIVLSYLLHSSCVNRSNKSKFLFEDKKSIALWLTSFMFVVLPMIVGGAVSTYRTESLAALPISLLLVKHIESKAILFGLLLISSALCLASIQLFVSAKLV